MCVRWVPRTEKKRDPNTAGIFRSHLFFCGKITLLPQRTPRGIIFHQKCVCAPPPRGAGGGDVLICNLTVDHGVGVALKRYCGKGEYQIILWYSLVSGRCRSWIYCVRKWSEIEMPFNFEGRSSLGCSRNRRAPLEHVKAATVRFSARAPTRKEKSLRQRKRRLEALRAKCGRGFTAKANERAHRYQHGVDYQIPQKKNIS